MLSQTEILLFVQNNKTYLHQQFGVNTIGLFGSFAIGKATEKSDIDFLVEFDNTEKDIFTKKNNLKTYLQNTFGRSVDIANPKYLKPFIKNQILQSALYV
ncbi:MAG: hypothetical protein RL708_1864 [Bacteroidota bacterium]|jgi:predicted nucleotidyltransferase